MMVEHVTVLTALQVVVASGASHKSPIVRTCASRLMDKLVTQLGAERVVGCSQEFQEIIFQAGHKLLIDSNVDARKHARHCFGQLIHHRKFESLELKFLKENERREIKKTLDSLQ